MFRYPKAIKDFQYDPNFAIRGLHYDYNNGWLMKIDNMGNIQLNTVHVGREPIHNKDEVIAQHHGLHISPDYLDENMFQLNDMFSLPQACILSDVLQYFRDNNMVFHPRYLCDDVSQAARILHTGTNIWSTHGYGGRLHATINRDVSRYLDPSSKLVTFLTKLRQRGKKIFLMTNSTLPFIDVGMTFLTSCKDWRDLFDVVIVSSRKPDFYHSRRPFRRTTEPTWGNVDALEPGEVYQSGNLNDFSRLTGWKGQKVLYFGDHIFSDLIDPTGAIIPELEREINIRNTASYRHTLSWLMRLERLLNEAQNLDLVTDRSQDLQQLVEEWRHERMLLRLELKVVFNRHFGSVFRTNANPTMFSQKMGRFADIYTSQLCNMDQVPRDFVFFPSRTYLPHESVVESLVDTGKIIHPFR
ncbi:HAD-superfamily hydrolase [Hesseltinella vesiculosa]|uniref:HAD-superfamily hydrolase n=1 Tax=Hesseltinella vesiculosa TaxID=101127 RepID=A0A1X2GYE1_9FUNG|nr:HAD-superfamily hydrolase [Hesseltinella vesiculosa]